MHRNRSLCDIQLVTDDGTIIYGHKIVLASVSEYFNSMLSHFGESNRNIVKMRDFNSTALQLLIEYMYTSKIEIHEKNVKVYLNCFLFVFNVL